MQTHLPSVEDAGNTEPWEIELDRQYPGGAGAGHQIGDIGTCGGRGHIIIEAGDLRIDNGSWRSRSATTGCRPCRIAEAGCDGRSAQPYQTVAAYRELCVSGSVHPECKADVCRVRGGIVQTKRLDRQRHRRGPCHVGGESAAAGEAVARQLPPRVDPRYCQCQKHKQD